jgi:ABC-2 type transport system permease protein
MRLAAQYGSAAAAIVHRDFRIYISYKLRFATQVAGSLFSIVIFYYVSRLVQVEGFTPDTYFAFVVVGLFIFAVLTSTFACAAVLRQELVAGTFERLATSAFGPVASTFSVMAFPILMSLVHGTVVVAVATVSFGLPLEWSTAPLAVPVAVLGALAFMPFGVFIAAAVLVAKQAMSAGNFLVAGISIIAGLYFPVTLLPGWIEWTSYVQPFTPAVDLMRHLLVGTPLSDPAWVALLKLAGFAAVLLPGAAIVLTAALRVARRRGTIIEY